MMMTLMMMIIIRISACAAILARVSGMHGEAPTNQLLKCDHHDHDYHDDHDEEDVYFVDDIDDEEGVYVVDDHDGGEEGLEQHAHEEEDICKRAQCQCVSDDENVNPKPMTSSLSLAIPIYYQHSVNIDTFIEMVDS